MQNKWGAHRLVGLDTDSRGYILVKVKNFSPLRGDMFRINNRSYASEATWDDVKTACLNTMNALIVFKWPTSPGTQVEGALADARSYILAYVGHFNLGKSRSAATTVGSCGTELVSSPNISFSSITATELNNNESRTQQLSIRFKCQYEGNSIANASPAVSGTGSGQTAMGFAIPIANQKAAFAQSLAVAGSSTAVSYLLSDGYGAETNVAPINLALYGPANKTGGNLDGWYGVTQNADIGQISPGGVDANGYRFYTQNFITEFKKLPGKTVLNGGKYRATAQFIIRVQ
ncbi:fimbrial protein [Sapientia aquatica]|uniref:fimbrial protein n=1 Tax=Sapientia aquatica TaxID=1549640 RepID=UPI00140445FB|nr:fimbrial protein [Sapientia aquatica]